MQLLFNITLSDDFSAFCDLKNLTGGPDGGQFVTDVTNASRTMLMNIKDLKWDEQLCRYVALS